MNNKINGLLTQKPTSPVPHVGEAHRYSLTERISKAGKPWTKVKAEGEGYGKLYEVVSVEKTDFVDSHGNVSYNVDLIEVSGAAEPKREWVDDGKVTPQGLPSPSHKPVIASRKDGLAACIDDAIYVLDSRLTKLVEESTPDARLDAVLRVALSLFIQQSRK